VRGSEASGSQERLRNIDPACSIFKLAGRQTRGDNMTIARIIAITAVICAAIGMTTQVEAAKRKAAGGSRITLIGCAYTELVCGTVMNFAGNIYALSPPVTPYTPLKVVGQKTGNVGLCGRTQVQVIASKPNPKGRCM
jgi:hypothetical protein